MAVYTILSKDDVEKIMSNYGNFNVVHHEELSGGSQNSNYLVKCPNDDFVLSVCEQNSDEEVQNLALLLDHLAHHNFSTSKLIKTLNGESMSYWNDKPVMIKRFITGTVEEEIPEHIVRLIGVEIGRLHKIPVPPYLPHSMSYGKAYFHEVSEYAKGSEYEKWLRAKHKYIESHITDSLPKSLIHSDVFSSNVIIDNSEEIVTIMDFEEATYYYRIFDIGMTIVGICREGTGIDFSKAKLLIKGYTQEIQLTDEELTCLQAFAVYAATAMSFWRHRNFNYTIPTPSLFNHYEELKQISDSIYQLDPQEFLDNIS